MAISKVIGTTTYQIATQGQRGWGPDTTNLLARLADVAQQVVSAQYILTTDNFFKDTSGQFGLKANFLKGVGAIASANGFIRMASPHANPGQGELFPVGTPEGRSYTYISWRNSLNSADLHLYPNTDNLTLSFAGKDQVNVDSAQTISNKILDNTNQVSGLSITNGSITDAQISAAAAISLTKLAPVSALRLLVSNGSGHVTALNVTVTEASYLSGATSNIQTQLNAKLGAPAPITPGTATKITYNSQGLVTAGTTLIASDIPTGINAANIGSGTVSNTEFGYLAGVTSAIQTQLNAKQATGNYLTALTGDVVATGPGSAAATIQNNAVNTNKLQDLSVTTAKLDALAVTAAKIADANVTNAKIAAGVDAVKIGAGLVSNTEFGYLAGVTSSIQTQLNAKIPSAILTTKGDLLTRNATANDRLPIGVNGQILRADSTTALGLKWDDESAGGGSGSGEKNYIGNANSATNWVASGAGIAVATETNAALLPDNNTQTTGIRVTRASGTAYVYYRFTLDTVDYNKKLKISKDVKYAGNLGDYTVRVFSNTASNYAGTSTELTVSPTTSLPGTGTGAQQAIMSFDSSGSAAPYIEVRVYGNAGTTPIYFNNFLVGPGVIGQIPAIGNWEVSTGTLFAGGAPVVTSQMYQQRVGPNLKVKGYVQYSAAGSAVGVLFNLPAGLTVDTTVINTDNRSYRFGSAGYFSPSFSDLKPFYFSPTQINFAITGTGNGYLASNIINGTRVSVDLDIPIAEWAGSGVNIGQNAQPEFAADDGTSDVFGPNGALVPNVAAGAGAINRDFVFSTPQSTTDLLILEYSFGGNGWTDASVFPYLGNANFSYGVRGYWLSSTVYRVQFGQGGQIPNAATWNTVSTVPWSGGFTNGDRFRVRKASAGSAVGFGLATATESGLVNPYNTSSGVVYSGRYTGVTTLGANVTTATSESLHYSRNGKEVTVSGRINLVLTAASGTPSSFEMTLPVSSNFTDTVDANGTGSVTAPSGTPYAGAIVGSSIANDRLTFAFNSPATGGQSLYFSCTYEVK